MELVTQRLGFAVPPVVSVPDTTRPEPAPDRPIGFRVHVLAVWVLSAFRPFRRRVRVVAAPVGSAMRHGIMYGSRDVLLGARGPNRGWE